MYDEDAIRRIEQILILRKLNISIKDIKRIFDTTGSEVVLDVLKKKIESIDDEISLLYQLKEIVFDFIQEIETLNFTVESDIKQLYDKAKEIEMQITNVDYIGKPFNVSRLIEVTNKLDEPDIMVVEFPSFKAITTGNPFMEDILKMVDTCFNYGSTITFFKRVYLIVWISQW